MSVGEARDSIVDGGLVRPLFELAWPVVLIQVLQVAYNISDTYWLGQLSAGAVGALSIAFPIIFFFISVGGFATAGSTLVSQYTGAESEGSAGKATGQTLVFVIGFAAILAIAGHVLTEELLALFPTQGETSATVIPLAAAYMRVFFLGTPLMFGFFVFSATMRGYGDTRTPMWIMAGSVAVNVFLDPALIFGWGPVPQMGIAGAAVATFISRALAVAAGIYVLFITTAGPDVRASHLWLDGGYVHDIVDIGLPSSLEQSAGSLAMITVTAMVVTYPPSVVAAYGLGNRLISLVFLPAMGVGRATNTMVGQNLGARQPERAARATWLAASVCGGIMLVMAIGTLVFAEPVVRLFMATGTETAVDTVDHGMDYLRIRTLDFAFIGVFQVVLGAFRGAGNTKTALAFSMVTLWVVRVPAIYYLAFVAGLGESGVWIGMTLGNVLGGITAVAWFTRGTWKERVIDTDAITT